MAPIFVFPLRHNLKVKAGVFLSWGKTAREIPNLVILHEELLALPENHRPLFQSLQRAVIYFFSLGHGLTWDPVEPSDHSDSTGSSTGERSSV